MRTRAIPAWEWDFGDGNVGTGPQPAHTYRIEGTYTVSLTVSDDHGSHTRTKDNHIVVGPCGNLPVRIASTGVTYPTLPEAYDMAEDMDVIQIQALSLTGPVTFDREVEIGLSCGHDCEYAAEPAVEAQIGGPLTFDKGTTVFGEGTLGITD
jgi:PKD repeat protein